MQNKSEELINEKTKAIFLETPTEFPQWCVQISFDYSNQIKEHNLMFIVDDTFYSPYFQRPMNMMQY